MGITVVTKPGRRSCSAVLMAQLSSIAPIEIEPDTRKANPAHDAFSKISLRSNALVSDGEMRSRREA